MNETKQTIWALLNKASIAPFITPILILLSVSLALMIPLYSQVDSDHPIIRDIRSGIRFLFPGILGLGFFPFFLMKKFNVPILSRNEHLHLLVMFRSLSIGYLFLLTVDVLTLVAFGDRISSLHPFLEGLVDALLALLVILFMAHAHWLNRLDFEQFQNLSREADTTIRDQTTSFKLLDSIDIRVLAAVQKSGGEMSRILLTGESIAEHQLTARLKKLLLLGYVEFYRDQLFYRFFLTPEGMDVLNLPGSLFATTIDNPEIIRQLAHIKHMLSREKNSEVVLECAKLLERLLKQQILSRDPHLDRIAGKPFERTTLGELIGQAHRMQITNRFEDLILNAINNLRSQKVAHSKDQHVAAILVDDAFFVTTLTEVFLKSIFSKVISAK